MTPASRVALVWVPLLFAGQARAQGPWRIESPGVPWSVRGDVKGGQDVSGAAMLGSREGLLISDETRAVQRFELDRMANRVVMHDVIPLLPGSKPELDLEGIAACPREACYYATGSHGVARKSGEPQSDRLRVFRIPVDSTTGVFQRGAIAVTTLRPVVASELLLRDASGQPGGAGGVEIEGLAERDGALFFGLRAPCIVGEALMIEVQAAALFADPSGTGHHLHRLALGSGFGIRDLARVRDGFLVLAGPSGSDEMAQGFRLYHWSWPDRALTRIGDIPTPPEGKAEALLVLEETSTDVETLVFFDGVKNGAPLGLRIFKQSP